MKGRLFCLLVCLYLLVASREPPWADAHVMYETAAQLVDKHRIDLDLGGPASFYAFHDGKKYGLYPIGNVVALVPSYALGRYLTAGLAKLTKTAPNDLLTVYLSHLSPSLLAAACCALFFGLARREGGSVRVALFLSLALGTMSILVIYARVAYSEALQSFLFVWLVCLAHRLGDDPAPGRGALAGFAAGWLVATKAVNILPVGVVLLYVAWRARGDRRRLLVAIVLAALTFLPWAALTLWLNKIKTGSYFDTGYSTAGGPNFSGQFYPALFGYLLSPGKSMFFFSPVLILGILGFPAYFRRDRGRAIFLLGVISAVLLPHLWFRAWYGGWVWGPRYTVPLTALILLPAACWLGPALSRGWTAARRAGVALLAVAGLWVQAAGCCFFWDFYVRMAIAVRPTDENLAYVATVFVPQFSPIVMHTWLAWQKMKGVAVMPDPPFKAVTLTVPNLSAHYTGLRFDFWWKQWLHAPGAAPRWAWIMIAVFLLGIIWAAVGLWRRARRESAVPDVTR